MRRADLDGERNCSFTATCGPVPEYMTCPNCGLDIEFWTAADITRCLFCGERVFYCESTVH